MRRMYSESELRQVVQKYAVEGLVGKDVIVKTIEQTEPNAFVEITAFPNITGGTSSPIFCRVQQLNKSLHIIMVGKITNNTEAEISDYGTSGINVDLPEEVASKIYDVLGNKASEAPASDTRISGCLSITQRGTSSNMSTYVNDVVMFVLNTATPNRIALTFGRTAVIAIPAGDTMYFDARLELDLI